MIVTPFENCSVIGFNQKEGQGIGHTYVFVCQEKRVKVTQLQQCTEN